jgi:hypothetical protein
VSALASKHGPISAMRKPTTIPRVGRPLKVVSDSLAEDLFLPMIAPPRRRYAEVSEAPKIRFR